MRLTLFLVGAALVSGAAIPFRSAEREMAFVRRAGLERERGMAARAAVQSTRATMEQDAVAVDPMALRRAPIPEPLPSALPVNPRKHGWDAVERGAVDIWVE